MMVVQTVVAMVEMKVVMMVAYSEIHLADRLAVMKVAMLVVQMVEDWVDY